MITIFGVLEVQFLGFHVPKAKITPILHFHEHAPGTCQAHSQFWHHSSPRGISRLVSKLVQKVKDPKDD